MEVLMPDINDPVTSQTSTKAPLFLRFWISLNRGVVRKLLTVWAITFAISFLLMFYFQFKVLSPEVMIVQLWSLQFFLIAVLALVCEYIDSTLGMGYGTTLTPLLLILPFGLEPIQIVPAILISQLLAGIPAAISHSEAGNVILKPGSRHFKIAMVLASCGIVGALIAVQIAVNISPYTLKIIIGAIILAVGIILIATRGRQFRFSWRKIFVLGVVASFNKALSGGGYGPVVIGGQLVSGVEGKPAIGITSLAEGLTCLVAVALFIIAGKITDLSLAIALAFGAICSIPLSAYTVRQLPQKNLVLSISIITVILGCWILYKALA